LSSTFLIQNFLQDSKRLRSSYVKLGYLHCHFLIFMLIVAVYERLRSMGTGARHKLPSCLR